MSSELRDTFACFGGECTVIVSGGSADAAVARARRALLGWHAQFSRFEAGSELTLLNADRRTTVPVTPMMRRIVEAAVSAARETGGLVDATLVDEIETAGYDRDLVPPRLPLDDALAFAPPRAPARPRDRWMDFQTDRRAGTVTRPPGVRLDSGGIAKGVFADELAAVLGDREAFVVDCCGDMRLAGPERQVHVQSPFDGTVLHTFAIAVGAVATSGIGRRAWVDCHGRPAHHLLDPASGRPAFTGIVQVTALAPTAVEAEMRSKAALLSGPERAAEWLPHGGLVVLDDGSSALVTAQRRRHARRATSTCHPSPAVARARSGFRGTARRTG